MSANNRFVFEGLAELRAELRNLPAALTHEASAIVVHAAEGAANAVRVEYGRHRVTGHLMNSVTVTQPEAGSYGVAMVVKVTDPIAWLFDHGSQARHWAGDKSTGIMFAKDGPTPPTHVFVKTMIAARRRMYEELAALLERHGLQVTGEP